MAVFTSYCALLLAGECAERSRDSAEKPKRGERELSEEWPLGYFSSVS
jgi:hypothetical protein